MADNARTLDFAVFFGVVARVPVFLLKVEIALDFGEGFFFFSNIFSEMGVRFELLSGNK